MSFKYWTVDNRDHTSCVFTTTWEFTVLALCKPGEHWWGSPKITQGVPGLLAEWMWGSEIDCDFYAVEPRGFSGLTWKAFAQ